MGTVGDESAAALIEEATLLPHGPTRMALAEDAVRSADASGDIALAYKARMSVLEAAVFGGYPERAIVAFGWLCATCDREPERFPQSRTLGGFLLLEVDLLWAYKWVVQNTPGFPQISRAQIEATLDEMESRYLRQGFSTRPVSMNRAWVGMELGEPPERIAEHFERWRRGPRDAYADCEACEQNFHVEIQRYLGNWALEVEAAQPLLHGEMSCAEVPHLTISNLVMPMFEHGELEEAARLHQRGYQMCCDNRDFLAEIAEHVDYRIVTGDVAGALELAERHIAWVAETRSGRRRWRWFVTLGELFDRLDDGDPKVRLPAAIAPDDSRPQTPRALSEWFRERADELSSAFDARNGNHSVSTRAIELRARLR